MLQEKKKCCTWHLTFIWFSSFHYWVKHTELNLTHCNSYSKEQLDTIYFRQLMHSISYLIWFSRIGILQLLYISQLVSSYRKKAIPWNNNVGPISRRLLNSGSLKFDSVLSLHCLPNLGCNVCVNSFSLKLICNITHLTAYEPRWIWFHF